MLSATYDSKGNRLNAHPLVIPTMFLLGLIIGSCNPNENIADGKGADDSGASYAAELDDSMESPMSMLASTSKLATGKACTSNSNCKSGYCADKVCCDKKCDATCYACTKALTGKSNGTCSPVSKGKKDGTCPNCSNGYCVLKDETTGCSADNDCKSGPVNSIGECANNGACLYKCKAGYRECGLLCIANGPNSCCNTSECLVSGPGVAGFACILHECNKHCEAGFILCGGKCSPASLCCYNYDSKTTRVGCPANNSCRNNKCLPCGERGATCCDGRKCKTGLKCSEETTCFDPTIDCGGEGRGCCPNNKCKGALTCVGTICVDRRTKNGASCGDDNECASGFCGTEQDSWPWKRVCCISDCRDRCSSSGIPERYCINNGNSCEDDIWDCPVP